jgi:hypothetical protein
MSVKAMTAITNATEAVATLEASHGVVAGDILEVTSGWPTLDQQVLRAKTVATNDVTLEGRNTVSTFEYPAGSGVGSVREISGWTLLSQVDQDINLSGGETEFRQIRLLSQRNNLEVPTTTSPVRMVVPAYFDPLLAWLPVARAARNAGAAIAVRLSMPGGRVAYGNARLSFADMPVVREGLYAINVSLAFAAEPVVYAT